MDISIDIDGKLASGMVNVIQTMKPSLCFIFRVPKMLRTVKESRYEPQIVSIGPYHYGKDTLYPFQGYKEVYLNAFLSRSTPQQDEYTCLKDMIEAIRDLEADARACYAEPNELSSDEFVKMMVLDGCFILEFLHRWEEERPETLKDDPIFSTKWMKQYIIRDLILLENQLPYLVLKRLFEFAANRDGSLTSLVTRLYHSILPAQPEKDSIEGKHILDMLRNLLLRVPNSNDQPYKNSTANIEQLVQAAGYYPINIEALVYGGMLVRRSKHGFLLDISIGRNRILLIPSIKMEEGFSVLLANIIALEQCRGDYKDEVTSYAKLVSLLVKYGKDVEILRLRGILQSTSQDDNTIVEEIQSLCQGAIIREFCYQDVCRQLLNYSGVPWNQWKRLLDREYLSKLPPWAVLSFVGASLGLTLTFIQTVYSIRK